jgi:hypothetical protein
MSSKVSNALHELVKSLSKSEKRYFKLYSSRHTIGQENNYIRLFDYIDQLEAYNEDQLFIDFKGEAFLNRFSITKKRLYDHILSALDAYHAGNSLEAQLFKQLHAFDILYEKALYNQCRRTLASAEKLAEKNMCKEILLLIQGKKKKLLETLGTDAVKENDIREISDKIRGIINGLNILDELWSSKSRLFMRLSEKGIARSEEERVAYHAVLGNLLELEEQKMDGEVRFLYNHTMAAYHFALGDFVTSFNWIERNIELIEKSAVKGLIPINRQISLMTNAIYLADKLGEHKRSLELLGKLKLLANISDLNEDLEIKLFSSISSIELSLNITKGDFDSAHQLVQEIGSGLERFDGKITVNRRAYLAFKLAVVQIGTGDYSEALKWINCILNDSKLDKTEDIYGFTLLLDLLVHIELNHEELLPYSLKSVQRFFKTRNRMYSFETVLLKFISKLIRCSDRFEAEEVWGELYNELIKVTDESAFESVALDYFDFKAWAESKIKGKPFKAIIRENYQSGMLSAS